MMAEEGDAGQVLEEAEGRAAGFADGLDVGSERRVENNASV